jgi:imidazolonepropionase-like amidohydrolase
MTVLRVRGVALPSGETVDLFADGDRWTTDPVAGATLVAQGWVIPGLVDAHTHPGAESPADPLDDRLLREDLLRHVANGVTLIRAPGLSGDPPAWFGAAPDTPRAVHAGPWIAEPGKFFDGGGVHVDRADLARTAAAHASRSGWAKIIADWNSGPQALPVDVLREIVAAVHAVGGRVAVHTQFAEGGAAAVAAGVDSVEHGMWLAHDQLDAMAAGGIALTPTLTVFTDHLAAVPDDPANPRAQWFRGGTLRHGALAAAAAEAGVTLLAGTDSRPMGTVRREIQALAAAGVPAGTALGAGSWTARAYLGLAGLIDGAPADAVVYANDPRVDLTELERPLAVVLRGRRITAAS